MPPVAETTDITRRRDFEHARRPNLSSAHEVYLTSFIPFMTELSVRPAPKVERTWTRQTREPCCQS